MIETLSRKLAVPRSGLILPHRHRQRGFIVDPFTSFPAGGGGPTDPYFANVTVLSHFDGSNGSTTLTNEIAGGPAIVGAAGDACISTTESLFGGASLRVQNLNVAGCASDPAFHYATGDYTFEIAIRPDALSGAQVWVDHRPTSTNGAYWALYTNGGDGILYFYANTGGINYATPSGTIVAATQNRIAVVRVGSTTYIFVGGASAGSFTDTTDYLQSQCLLGRSSYNTGQSTGYFDEWRVTKGVGRYTSAYTPDASAFPNS